MTTLTGIAKRVHDDILALPPEAAAMYATMVVGAALEHDLETHAEMIDARVGQIVATRVETVKKSLVRSAISKAASGGEVEALGYAHDLLSKAAFDHLTTAERRRLVQLQDRDDSGRFKAMHRKITYRTTQPMKPNLASHHGIPVPDKKIGLGETDKARYQQAYLQVADMVDQFADVPLGAGTLMLTFTDAAGMPASEVRTLDRDHLKQAIDPAKFRGGQRLVDAQVVVDSERSPEAAAFNLVSALGSPAVAGRVAAGATLDENGFAPGAQRLGSFAEDWDRQMDGDAANPSNRVFRRLRSGSKLLSDIAGPNAPTQLQMALRAGDLVGQYGPEAQKVIGPHADRAAYRYRGVEKTPDPALQASVNGMKTMADRDGRTGESARHAMLHGFTRVHARRPGEAPRREEVPSPLVEHLRNRLPSQELTHLQRKSGVIPPSEGIIIDKKGKVITQAVGYGDDWYLPFNLKTLSKLKGGDYIRTRTWGGPTTEDVYAGLVSGARSLTVVSHNGTYTIEFDDTFRGKRRYNDKAARMVKRYGHLLDAAKSKQVTADIPPERMEELRREVSRETGLSATRREDRRKFAAELEEAMADERQNPTMPDAYRDAVVEEFVTGKAGHLATAEGFAGDWTALAEHHVNRQVAEMRAFHGQFTPELDFNEAEARAAALERFGSPEKLVAALGWTKELEDAMTAAELDYKSKHGPLQLDGEGYHQSLQALREQFPYYIASVEYKPNLRGGTDYGYVKPRFNRPEGALAGFFDESILGTGKITADKTRHQNRGVSVTRKPEADKTPAGARGATSGSRVVASEADADLDRLEALKRLHSHARGLDSFMHNGKPQPVSVQNRAELKQIAPHIHGMSFEELMATLGNDLGKASAAVLSEVDALRDKGFSVPAPMVDAVKSPERAKKGVPYSLMGALANSGQNFDFGDELAPGHTAHHYERMAATRIARLGLPEGASDAELDALVENTKDNYSTARRLGDSGKMSALADRLKLGIEAKTALRRKDEAAALEAEKIRLQTEFVIHENENSLPAHLREARPALANDKTIQGDTAATLRETLRETKRDEDADR